MITLEILTPCVLFYCKSRCNGGCDIMEYTRDYRKFAFDLAISRDYRRTDGRTDIGKILNVG